MIFPNGDGAKFSDDMRFRYVLARRWGEGLRFVNFVMLNPSTADAQHDDPTIRRCKGFAKDWGFDGLYVTNLFAFRATNPRALRSVEDPVGPENDEWLREVAQRSEMIVLAWGAHGKYQGRSQMVRNWLALYGAGRKLHVIRLNATGEPSHPLYLPSNMRPARL